MVYLPNCMLIQQIMQIASHYQLQIITTKLIALSLWGYYKRPYVCLSVCPPICNMHELLHTYSYSPMNLRNYAFICFFFKGFLL